MRVRTSVLVAAVCGLLFAGGIATAQAFLYPLLLGDVKVNGTSLGYFNKAPSVHNWNFTGAITPSISGYTMTIPGAVQATTDLGTCAVGIRGGFSTLETTSVVDGGVKDKTYQCCRAQGLTYGWVAVACQ